MFPVRPRRERRAVGAPRVLRRRPSLVCPHARTARLVRARAVGARVGVKRGKLAASAKNEGVFFDDKCDESAFSVTKILCGSGISTFYQTARHTVLVHVKSDREDRAKIISLQTKKCVIN